MDQQFQSGKSSAAVNQCLFFWGHWNQQGEQKKNKKELNSVSHYWVRKQMEKSPASWPPKYPPTHSSILIIS